MHEGEEYAIQYMPVGMQTIESPPEFMLAQMLYAGVDHCILQAGGGYGAMNDFNAFTQRAFPKNSPGCCTSTRRWRIATRCSPRPTARMRSA